MLETNNRAAEDHKTSLLKCLTILECLGDDYVYSGTLNSNLQRIENQCLKDIDKNEFKHVVSVLEVLDGTLGPISKVKIKCLQDTAQWQQVVRLSNKIKEKLAKHLDMQLKNIQGLVENVKSSNDDENKHVTFETTLTNLKQAY